MNHDTGLSVWLDVCLDGPSHVSVGKKSQWVSHGKFPWPCDLTYSAIIAAIVKLKSDREPRIISWSYSERMMHVHFLCLSFLICWRKSYSKHHIWLYFKIIMVIVLVIQSVFAWAVLQSSKNLEHKQETCVISSPVSYIALLVGHLVTSGKEDIHVNVNQFHIVSLFQIKGGVIHFILYQMLTGCKC